MRTASNAFFGCNPEDYCGERNIALYTDAFYFAVEITYLIVDFEDAACYLDGENDCSYLDEWEYYLAEILDVMDTIDYYYDVFIDLPGDGTSDAIVQGPSQYYPYTTAVQYPLLGADSHTGALKNTYVHSALDAMLANQFKVPTQGSLCTFAASSPQNSVASTGGSGTLSVTAASGCQWSAVSEAPWISITAHPNGTSNGTVSFTAATNPSTVPRIGSVQVGNGSLASLLQISQPGNQSLCTFSLPGGGSVDSRSGGESESVQVTTQQDCVWSAVSSAGWITVTAGATGSGPGSFTWTTSPNTSNAQRTGTITVGGSTTLTITDGSPLGTPATVTVTLAGNPEVITVNPCAGNPVGNCSFTEPNSGTVTISVQGIVFSTSYGPYDTAAGLAQNLASQINATEASPVTATVLSSGTQFAITSILNGAQTDYPISTSATFNTQYFQGPAFWATASNTQLTGGSN